MKFYRITLEGGNVLVRIFPALNKEAAVRKFTDKLVSSGCNAPNFPLIVEEVEKEDLPKEMELLGKISTNPRTIKKSWEVKDYESQY